MNLVLSKKNSIDTMDVTSSSVRLGRYVINLVTSAKPNRIPASRTRPIATGTADYQHLHFYQLSQIDGGRACYRLRLGPFETDLQCDAVLAVVRNRYADAHRVEMDEADREALRPAITRSASLEHLAQRMLDPNYSIESTGTTRALSNAELNESQSAKCYCIQLMVADHVVSPDEVPAMDILEFYRLYAISAHNDGKLHHSLRLGFFSDAGSAEVVAVYLRRYFNHAEVLRISNDEAQRFKSSKFKAKKDVGATGQHLVVELKATRD